MKRKHLLGDQGYQKDNRHVELSNISFIINQFKGDGTQNYQPNFNAIHDLLKSKTFSIADFEVLFKNLSLYYQNNFKTKNLGEDYANLLSLSYEKIIEGGNFNKLFINWIKQLPPKMKLSKVAYFIGNISLLSKSKSHQFTPDHIICLLKNFDELFASSQFFHNQATSLMFNRLHHLVHQDLASDIYASIAYHINSILKKLSTHQLAFKNYSMIIQGLIQLPLSVNNQLDSIIVKPLINKMINDRNSLYDDSVLFFYSLSLVPQTLPHWLEMDKINVLLNKIIELGSEKEILKDTTITFQGLFKCSKDQAKELDQKLLRLLLMRLLDYPNSYAIVVFLFYLSKSESFQNWLSAEDINVLLQKFTQLEKKSINFSKIPMLLSGLFELPKNLFEQLNQQIIYDIITMFSYSPSLSSDDISSFFILFQTHENKEIFIKTEHVTTLLEKFIQYTEKEFQEPIIQSINIILHGSLKLNDQMDQKNKNLMNILLKRYVDHADFTPDGIVPLFIRLKELETFPTWLNTNDYNLLLERFLKFPENKFKHPFVKRSSIILCGLIRVQNDPQSKADQDYFDRFITTFIHHPDLNFDSIAILFFNLSKLAILPNWLKVKHINVLLDRFLQFKDVTLKDMNMVFSYLFRLTEKQQSLLERKHTECLLNSYLNHSAPTSRRINHFLKQLGNSTIFPSWVSAKNINSLLKFFTEKNQDVHKNDGILNTVLRMMQIPIIKDQIDIGIVHNILINFVILEPVNLSKISPIFQLILLLENTKHSLDKKITLAFLNRVENQLINSEAYQDSGIIIDALQVIRKCVPKNEQLSHLVFFAKFIADQYLHPQFAAKLIHHLVPFQHYQNELTPLFEKCIGAMALLQSTRFDKATAEELKNDAKNLIDPWKGMLNEYFNDDQDTESKDNQSITESTPNARSNIEQSPTTKKTAALPARKADSKLSKAVIKPNTKSTSKSKLGDLDNLPSTNKNSNKKKSTIQKTTTTTATSATTRTTVQKSKTLSKKIQKKFVDISKLPKKHQELIASIEDAVEKNDFSHFLRLLKLDPDKLSRLHSYQNNRHHRRNEKNIFNTNESSDQVNKHYPEIENLVRDFILKMPVNYWPVLLEGKKNDHRIFRYLLQACSDHMKHEIANKFGLHSVISLLSLKELTIFFNEYLKDRFQFYRNRISIGRLIDALTIRYDNHPDEQARILTIQKNFLNRALEFHQLCHHHHVVEQIESDLHNLADPNFMITLEDDDDEEEDIEEEFELDSLSAQSEPDFLPLSSSQNKPIMCLDYLYTDTDWNNMMCAVIEDGGNRLKSNLKFKSNLHVLAVANRDGLGRNAPSDVLNSLATEMVSEKPIIPPGKYILPVAIPNPPHWVVLVLTVVFDEIESSHIVKKIKYYDSNLSRRKVNGYYHQIMDELKTNGYISDATIIEIDRRGLMQPDSSSCGPFSVKNVFEDLCHTYQSSQENQTTHLATRKTCIAIREEQAEILRRVNKNDYDIFYPTQLTNTITVEPINKQLARYAKSNSQATQPSISTHLQSDDEATGIDDESTVIDQSTEEQSYSEEITDSVVEPQVKRDGTGQKQPRFQGFSTNQPLQLFPDPLTAANMSSSGVVKTNNEDTIIEEISENDNEESSQEGTTVSEEITVDSFKVNKLIFKIPPSIIGDETTLKSQESHQASSKSHLTTFSHFSQQRIESKSDTIQLPQAVVKKRLKTSKLSIFIPSEIAYKVINKIEQQKQAASTKNDKQKEWDKIMDIKMISNKK